MADLASVRAEIACARKLVNWQRQDILTLTGRDIPTADAERVLAQQLARLDTDPNVTPFLKALNRLRRESHPAR